MTGSAVEKKKEHLKEFNNLDNFKLHSILCVQM